MRQQRETAIAQTSPDPGLDAWLAPFLAAMGHKKRHRWAPLYMRSLLGLGARKSLQPTGHDQLGDGAAWTNNRHLPGAEVWLVGEGRASGERKVYLSNLPPRTTRRALVGTIKAR